MLENETTLERHRITEHCDDSCKEAREHKQLGFARELWARLRRRA